MINKYNVRLTQDRDFHLLRFIWRWKVVPTDVISKRFFPGRKIRTCYNRLVSLRNENYLDNLVIRDIPQSVWTLDRKGFNAIKEFLPPDCNKGWKSEAPAHDVMALKLNLGDLTTDRKADGLVFTEQELRTYSPAVFPYWVPKTFRRRPDGYIKSTRGGQEKSIAIEVELTPKSIAEYECIALDYAHYRDIDHVIWAVESERMAQGLQSIFANNPRDGQQMHSFMLASDIHKFGWSSAVIEGGYKGQTVRQLIESHWQNPKSETPQYVTST
jgi:hypothetical protein